MSRVLVIGAGSCIIEAILNHCRTIPGLDERAELYLSQILPGGRAAVPAEMLRRCGILIEEAAPWQGAGTLSAEERALLPESCARVTVPTLHFNSLWPLMAEDPRNVPEPGAPYGRIPFGMGDRLALRVIETVADPAARRAAYDATDLRSVANLARSHELEVRNCFAREQGCDVRVAGYVMSHFRDKRLYYTHNHPTGELMFFVLAQLFAVPVLRDLIQLPYDRLVVGARAWADGSNVFGGEEAPIHPAVAEHFGLRWWRRDLTYAWLAERRTFDQWIDWYLTYVPGIETAPLSSPAEPVAVLPGHRLSAGDYLVTLRDRRQVKEVANLAAPVRLGRALPYFATPIDAAIAPYGTCFSDPEFAAYDASETFVASLGEAAVIGGCGAVVHRGKVLGDTFRELWVGEESPAIAAVGADYLELQPQIALAPRWLPEPHFCGFSGGWRDEAHWLIGSLPRLVAYLRLVEMQPNLKLLLPALPAGSGQQQTLDLLSIPPDVVTELGGGEVLACRDLWVTGALDLWRMPPFCRQAASFIAGLVRSKGAPAAAERVLLRPAAAMQRIVNFEAVADRLAGNGFVVLSLHELSMPERIRAISGARLIVGQHCPLLAYSLFAGPGARVMELFPPAAVQPLYWSLASSAGLQYGFLVGTDRAAPGTLPMPDTPFEVPLETLDRAVAAMLGHA